MLMPMSVLGGQALQSSPRNAEPLPSKRLGAYFGYCPTLALLGLWTSVLKIEGLGFRGLGFRV